MRGPLGMPRIQMSVYVNGFKKRPWLLPAIVVITVALGTMSVLLAWEAVICASLGDWRATRSYTLTAVIFLAGLAFFWWGYAGVRVQQLDDRGVTTLTVRGGRIALPWVAIKRARFESGTARLESGTTRTRIGFAMYSDYRAAEAFARDRLAEVGAEVEG
jgi:hypothetical protein